MHPEVVGSEQALLLRRFLLPQLKSEQAITQKVLSAVPVGREDYRPDVKSRSAFELARHIAFTEIWFLDAVLSKRFEEIASGSVRSCADVVRWYRDNVARCIAGLEELSGEDLATPVDWLGLRNDPAVAYLNIAIRHSVHHRGQLSSYLRPMGARVPAIYVESGDEPFPPVDGSTPKEPPPAF